MSTVRDLLKARTDKSIWSLSPEMTVLEALRAMSDHNVGAMPVLEGDRLIGVFSERDYTRKVVLKGKSSKTTAVKEILSSQVIHVTPSHTVQECLRLMTDHHFRHLPVLEGDKLAGIVSIGDLVNWIISAQQSTISQLQTYITGVPG